MEVNPNIFKEYDIRGEYPKEINKKIVYKIAQGFIKFLKLKPQDTLVIGMDKRKSSVKLLQAFVSGSIDLGINIIDIGRIDTPFLYFAVPYLKTKGGIMITASHNPQKFNGIKMIDKNSEFISGKEIKNAALKIQEKKSKNKGTIKKIDIKKNYLERIFEDFDSKKINVSYSLDYDGDRLIVKNEKGEILRGDILGAIIADYFVRKGDKIIYDLRCSHIIPEYFENKGIKTMPCKTGRYNIQKTMEARNAIFGMEITGHYFFKKFNSCESPLYCLRILTEYMEKTGKSINELAKPFEKYVHSGVLNFKIKNLKILIKKLKEKYKNGTQNYLDGLTVEFSNWWFNIRSSNTEPLVRLVIEAKNQNLLKQKKKELFHLFFP